MTFSWFEEMIPGKGTRALDNKEMWFLYISGTLKKLMVKVGCNINYYANLAFYIFSEYNPQINYIDKKIRSCGFKSYSKSLIKDVLKVLDDLNHIS
ncbi:14511_t:CDS:2 [Gigaspora rosea]|nr:14511_t:CDS:2 [Gigaspora rosea]